jgi:hypothetical protein
MCCAAYLPDFVPVSIKMAKEQNLSLNPTKISGNCGRLMCCLKNEQEAYEELNKHLPGVGDVIMTDDGVRGRVDAVDVLRQRVWLMVHDDEGNTIEKIEIGADKVAYRISRGKKNKGKKYIPDATEEELRALEDKDSDNKADEDRPAEKREEKRRERRDNRNREDKNRDGQGRDNKNRDGQNQEHQNRDGQKGDRQNRDGQNRDRQNQDRQNQDGKNRDNKPRDKKWDNRKKRYNRDKKKPDNKNEN